MYHLDVCFTGRALQLFNKGAPCHHQFILAAVVHCERLCNIWFCNLDNVLICKAISSWKVIKKTLGFCHRKNASFKIFKRLEFTIPQLSKCFSFNSLNFHVNYASPGLRSFNET